jgi:hypothetical protein
MDDPPFKIIFCRERYRYILSGFLPDIYLFWLIITQANAYNTFKKYFPSENKGMYCKLIFELCNQTYQLCNFNIFRNIILKQELMERIKSPSCVTLFNNTVSFILFNYSKLHALVSIPTSSTIVTVFKQWVQLWYPLLHKYGLKYHTKMVCWPWLPNLILNSPRLIDAALHPPQNFEQPPF